MAKHLASFFGTEHDKVNCPFYYKVGACRHGDRCSRLHINSVSSPTLLLHHMYRRPDVIMPGYDAQGNVIESRRIQEHFEDFFVGVYEELKKFGNILKLHVCDNLSDHLVGNVYVQYENENQAAAALEALQGRVYWGVPICAEFSNVTNFRAAICRDFIEKNGCKKGLRECSFIHLKPIEKEIFQWLRGSGRTRERSRSPRPYRRREEERVDRNRDI